MGVNLKVGEIVAVPPDETKTLFLDDDGAAQLLSDDGTRATLGGGGTADGVSIDGVGSEGDPFAIIPAYIQTLTGAGWTRIDVGVAAADVDIDFDGEAVEAIDIMGVVPNNNAAGSTLSIQPLVLDAPVVTNQSAQELGGSGALTVTQASGAVGTGNISAFAWTVLAVGFAAAEGSTIVAVRMTTKTGAPRATFGQYLTRNSSNAITNHTTIQGVWQEAVSAMTGVRLHSDRADGIDAGSVFWWRTTPLAT